MGILRLKLTLQKANIYFDFGFKFSNFGHTLNLQFQTSAYYPFSSIQCPFFPIEPENEHRCRTSVLEGKMAEMSHSGVLIE